VEDLHEREREREREREGGRERDRQTEEKRFNRLSYRTVGFPIVTP